MSRQAFDALAPDYDRDFTTSGIARHLRSRVQARLLSYAPPGASVLELGCGTGEDACFLAEHGCTVTATDASTAMLEMARAKCAGRGSVRFERLDLNGDLAPWVVSPEYAVIFANFGVLNCVRDLTRLSHWLSARLAPGGVAAFGVMAPWCLWEIGWHALHGEFSTAVRRLNTRTTFQPDPSGPAIPLQYPTVAQLTRAFAAGFQRTEVQPLGVFLPPSDVYGPVERRPRLLSLLTGLDDSMGRVRWLANFADHYWIAFRRR